jgi:hypothetical protein
MPQLRGSIVDPAGRPVPGAAVYFVRGPVALPDIAAQTGADGAFSLHAPAPGAYRVGARAEGFEAQEAEVGVPAEGRIDLVIRLRGANR